MTSDSLDIEFNEAVERINSYTEPFPADLLLRLYAYYKKATNNYSSPKGKKPMITAFKTNALFQVKNVTPDEAKRIYIDLVNHYFLYGK
ncbi:acyl-CoA-binding protein [Gelidibacter gilvus]|uniref:Acyl-CoA-binding protein n=1 Tax=Gelidibacter gilvus TaxID=59602 RepID=A0A4Q0XC61_9FLAO|nr:acyl-CoA-binding protein [Gelidibacter gilvus]RXJ45511.1 acyl-CoA-binding protein [Gelidibacter gilvus]